MKLEQLGTDFNTLNLEKQRVFFFQYSDRRATDLAKPVTFRRQKSSSSKKKGKNIKITLETMEILKGLGLV